ncbi:MAG: hypothetical protein JWP44_4521 [Mucilaginibacter sp.]|nr:hypothetical protein [Mucilaginibacter sp.]
MPRIVWKEYQVTCCAQCAREIVAGWASGRKAFPPGRVFHRDDGGSFMTNLSIADMRVLVRNSAMRHRVDVTDYITGYEPGTTPPWDIDPAAEVVSSGVRVTQKQHGGRRDGAGRKPMPAEQRKVHISAKIDPATAAAIKAERRPDEPLGAAIDRLIAAGLRASAEE